MTGSTPWLMFLLTHEVKSGDGQVLSKRLQFVRVNPDGSTSFAGWAPHLDLEPLAEPSGPSSKDVLAAPWIRADQEQRAIALAASTLVPEHFREVAERRVAHVDKTLAAVHERLTQGNRLLVRPLAQAQGRPAAGKDVRLERRKRSTHRDRPRRPLGEPEEGTPVDAARRQRHADRPRRCPCRSRGLMRQLRGDEETGS